MNRNKAATTTPRKYQHAIHPQLKIIFYRNIIIIVVAKLFDGKKS